MTTALLRTVNGQRERFCRKCQEWWPDTSEFFHHNEKKDGFRSPCKACINEKRMQSAATKTCCVPGCTNPRYHWRFARCYEHRTYAMKKKSVSHEVDMTRTCNHPGCSSPRWLGPSGTNFKLVYCEDHQRTYWRDKKAANRGGAPVRKRQPRIPKESKKARPSAKKVVTVNHKQGILIVRMKLDEVHQLNTLLDCYRERGYTIQEKP